MGYDLHIVRLKDYADEEEISNISFNEWLEYVLSDSELDLVNGYELKLPGIDSKWYERPGFCMWVAHPENDGDPNAWLDYEGGSIRAKNPDSFTIAKMVDIAAHLNGRVRGDHFEYYDNRFLQNQKAETVNLVGKDVKPWWKFW